MAFRNGKAGSLLCGTEAPPTDPSDFPVTCEADCPASISVDDLVYVSGTEVGGIVQVDLADPVIMAKMPAVGIVTVKSTATRCTVHKLGLVTPSVGLIAGARYYVGLTGVLSLDPPFQTDPEIEIIIQTVGYAVKSNQLLFNVGDFAAGFDTILIDDDSGNVVVDDITGNMLVNQ